MKKSVILSMIVFIIIFAISFTVVFADDYFVSNSGNDNNSGMSESEPWKTLSKVNSHPLKPGDVVHFKSGDIWREQFIPTSGSANGYVTYTSYGTGSKPAFLGSIDRSDSKYWKEVSENIWELEYTDNYTQAALTAPIHDIVFWKGEDMQFENSIIKENSGEEYLKVKANAAGQDPYLVQVSLKELKIEKDKNYTFNFRAKASTKFELSYITLMKDDSPWSDSSTIYTDRSPEITTEWKDYQITYQSNTDDDNARVTMYLGDSLPQGAEICIGSISFAEVSDSGVYNDVGNIIFNNGASTGRKVFSPNNLKKQGDFWYDTEGYTVRMYSEKNPGMMYNSIECALNRHIINQSEKSYVVYDNLAIKYGGAHGISGEDTHHIQILNCDISYIGGGTMEFFGKIVRYGNGIEFWDNAHDNLVEGCNIWEIFDTALSNQGRTDGNKQYNITYRKNNIWKAQWSYELWNNDLNSTMSDIYFENNNCKDAGYSWGRNQRSDEEGGVHLILFDSTAQASRIFIRNNTFDNAEEMSFYLSSNWNGSENLTIENNLYIQPRNKVLAQYNNKNYLAVNFSQYRSASGFDTDSEWKDDNTANVALNK